MSNHMSAEGISYYEQGVALALQSPARTSEESSTLIDLCSELGDWFIIVGDNQKALHYFDIGLPVAEKDPTDPRGGRMRLERKKCEMEKVEIAEEQPVEPRMLELRENPDEKVESEAKELLSKRDLSLGS